MRKRTYSAQQEDANDFVRGWTAKHQRPIKCTVCERTDKPIQGHHPDPVKVDEVVWVDQSCHRKLEVGLIPTEPWMITIIKR
jgi:hypothetical protein